MKDFNIICTFCLLACLVDLVEGCENVAQLGWREQKLCSEASAEGAIRFHQSGWSLQPFPLSALSLVLEEDNQGAELHVASSGR